MIYLCSVYSVQTKGMPFPIYGSLIRQRRYDYAAKKTAEYLKEGHTIFCPINHCHPLSTRYDMPTDWEFWRRHDLNYLINSEEMWVLKMPGWESSVGITAEIKFAEDNDIPVKYIECEDYLNE